jgi:hypothetical protein
MYWMADSTISIFESLVMTGISEAAGVEVSFGDPFGSSVEVAFGKTRASLSSASFNRSRRCCSLAFRVACLLVICCDTTDTMSVGFFPGKEGTGFAKPCTEGYHSAGAYRKREKADDEQTPLSSNDSTGLSALLGSSGRPIVVAVAGLCLCISNPPGGPDPAVPKRRCE